MNLEVAEVFDGEDRKMGLADLRVLYRLRAPIEFNGDVLCEAKVLNHWVEIPCFWTIKKMPGVGLDTDPPSAASLALLVPANTTACRFRFKYRFGARSWSPLGIGDPFARRNAPSWASLRAQQMTARVSRPLYDSLWPTNLAQAGGRPGPWRKTTAELEFPEGFSKRE